MANSESVTQEAFTGRSNSATNVRSVQTLGCDKRKSNFHRLQKIS